MVSQDHESFCVFLVTLVVRRPWNIHTSTQNVKHNCIQAIHRKGTLHKKKSETVFFYQRALSGKKPETASKGVWLWVPAPEVFLSSYKILVTVFGTMFQIRIFLETVPILWGETNLESFFVKEICKYLSLFCPKCQFLVAWAGKLINCLDLAIKKTDCACYIILATISIVYG